MSQATGTAIAIEAAVTEAASPAVRASTAAVRQSSAVSSAGPRSPRTTTAR